MANLSDNKHVYNKAFSHKIPSGGKMRVGSLVKHTEYGLMGVAVEQSEWRSRWLIQWNGSGSRFWCHRDDLEVVCK